MFCRTGSGACWDPAAGLGHMSEVLSETFGQVRASDIFDYGLGHEIGSFIDGFPGCTTDVICVNPPFIAAAAFAERALDCAGDAVGLLVRSVWAEGVDRYGRLFRERPPSIIAQFVERVPMVKGRWDPAASTATAYAWFVWLLPLDGSTRFMWIPPGCRVGLTRPDDVRRFAA
jgi:hypothetical protein